MTAPDRTPGSDDPDGGADGHRPATATGRWWESGEEPDYRATLANERTLLSWLRAALALLAGALGVLQLVRISPTALRLALASYLVALSVGSTLIGYRQWRRRQASMRRREAFGHSELPAFLALALLLLAALVVAVVAVGPY
ncbi:DUF202 domain-containing protein [Streptomyces sp. NPDC090052]|uniref:DUF202 domain-containing protein n=1 Tax=Streptomyces sp. NPDC090052 TaxID=3365931 RepID=UPI003814CEC4